MKIINSIIFVIGVLFIIYFFLLTSVMGIIVFSLNILLLGVLLVIFSFVNKIMLQNAIYKKFIKICIPIVIVLMILFLIIVGTVVRYSIIKDTTD